MGSFLWYIDFFENYLTLDFRKITLWEIRIFTTIHVKPGTEPKFSNCFVQLVQLGI